LELEEANNALRLKEVQLASKTSIIKNLEQSAETFKKQLKKLEDKDKEASKGTPQTPSYEYHTFHLVSTHNSIPIARKSRSKMECCLRQRPMYQPIAKISQK
jgi:dTDP-4-amino-4,6-dideoxygalactose transaminase